MWCPAFGEHQKGILRCQCSSLGPDRRRGVRCVSDQHDSTTMPAVEPHLLHRRVGTGRRDLRAPTTRRAEPVGDSRRTLTTTIAGQGPLAHHPKWPRRSHRRARRPPGSTRTCRQQPTTRTSSPRQVRCHEPTARGPPRLGAGRRGGNGRPRSARTRSVPATSPW